MLSDRLDASEPAANDYFALLNLVHEYADAVDDGDFDRVGALFVDADVYLPGWTGPAVRARTGDFGQLLRDVVRVYPPRNTPRTRHVTTNHQIAFEGSTAARMRSYFSVFQEVAPGNLQPIICGTYDDRFAKVDGKWRFTERRQAVTAIGDLSAHLRVELNLPLDN